MQGREEGMDRQTEEKEGIKGGVVKCGNGHDDTILVKLLTFCRT